MDGVRRGRDRETSVIRAFSAFFGSVEMEKHLTKLWPEIRPVSRSKRAGRAGIEPTTFALPCTPTRQSIVVLLVTKCLSQIQIRGGIELPQSNDFDLITHTNGSKVFQLISHQSSSPRNRTSSNSFEDCRANPAHSQAVKQALGIRH